MLCSQIQEAESTVQLVQFLGIEERVGTTYTLLTLTDEDCFTVTAAQDVLQSMFMFGDDEELLEVLTVDKVEVVMKGK